MNWRKSSRSMNNGNCVEVGDWRKSSFSGDTECVEAGSGAGTVAVRDTQDRDGVTLAFPADTWTRFLGSLR